MTQLARLLAPALVFAVPAAALAQTQTGAFGSRLPTVTLGQDGWVTSKDGREVHGRALDGAYCDAGSFVLGSAVYIGVGAGVGALVDMALKGLESIYESVTTAPSVSVAPIVGRQSLGVGGVIRWGR